MEDDDTLLGTTVLDGRGQVVGRVSGLLVDPVSSTGRWLRLRVALGRGSTVIPLMVASANGQGQLIIPYDLATVTAAPSPLGDVVSEPEAEALLQHYGLSE